MNLTIDIGNSLTKVAVFEKDKLILKEHLNELNTPHLDEIEKKTGIIDKAIVCSVKGIEEDIESYCKEKYNDYIILNHNTHLPFNNLYKTPVTLGKDRIAAVAGAYYLYPTSNVLIIDIGTAIAFDLLTDGGKYIGGNISPGINLRFKSLNEHTRDLPLLNAEKTKNLIGDDTQSAINNGVINGIIFEINGYINLLQTKYSTLKIVFTGGNASMFENKIKSSIFVRPNLVLIGLNQILEYNAN